MSTEQRPIHSPLGASSAERWMNCPGSVALIKALKLDEETDEPEYRSLGIAAHEAGAHCLKNKLDAWEVISEKFHDIEVDQDMAQAIQVYIDTVRPSMEIEGAKVYIEHSIAYKQVDGHVTEILDPRADGLLKKYFYGTGDFGVAYGICLECTDYKHGEGIEVEVENNPQLIYYAFGFLLLHPDAKHVLLRIVQPRIGWVEPVKEWWVEADFIREYVATKLVPAMQLTEMDGAELDAGSWCRFCPAKLICPMMASLFGAATRSNPKEVIELSDQSLGRSYQYRSAVKAYLNAMEEEALRRLNLGKKIAGIKLVPKKANRVFKSEAPAIFKAKFGKDAMTPSEIKSPAEMERLGAEAKELVKEYAYTPQTGLTVAVDTDKRVAVKVQTTEEAFGHAIKNMRTERDRI
jgi:hypothetical protein